MRTTRRRDNVESLQRRNHFLHRQLPIGRLLLGEGERLGRGVTMVVVTPSVDHQWVAAARDVRRRGVTVIAVLIDPSTFGGPSGAESVLGELQASRIPSYLVRNGDNLSEALSRQMSFARPRF